ncbi:MAG: SGNH/GDSL hydrolase family protein [Ruminiclostridium sp.]|nr:SGNH/GDSL hydrolase family protein [Ruminiclostridium sp.]
MEGVVYYDVKKEPFRIYGLYEAQSEGEFCRLPEDVARETSPGVFRLYKNTAGGRVRFKTDSDTVAVKAKLDSCAPSFHCSALLQCGFDLYIDEKRGSVFMGSVNPPFSTKGEYEFQIRLPAGEKELTLNMPLYGGVSSLEIGLKEGASLSAHSDYKYEKPIVFYGSSITQGAWASRPGKSYEAIISRRYDCNYTNLGFAGNCKAEDVIVQYMSGLEMSAFVSDYDHNAGNEHLINTHYKMYEAVRAKNPDIPYYMISKPDFYFDNDNTARRATIMESYLKAWKNGDKNVYFIDGSAFFNSVDIADCTSDRCHPTDDGFRRMADYIGDVIAKTMRLERG